ncbi:MAG: hypothetical protein H7329_11295 [Opitutaceae bacterium]|nr:hypothetical protein [Cytophagales bacterium]
MNYKLQLALVLAIGILCSCKKDKSEPGPEPQLMADTSARFHLNIIGKPDEKKNDDYNGSRLFVLRNGLTKIWLKEGPFALSSEKLSDTTATLYLPTPDQNKDGKLDYTLYARPLATPGGSAKLIVCATDTATGLEVCSKTLYAVRNTGKPESINISDSLYYINADLNKDSISEIYPLFHPRLKNYIIKYDNNGLKLLQLSFYPKK